MEEIGEEKVDKYKKIVVSSHTEHDSIEDSDDELPPDEGIAWVMAIICSLSMFSTWGSNASFGVFLNYYITNNIFPEASIYDYALIGGIIIGFAQGLAPFTAVIYNVLGIRWMIMIGVFLQTLGYILASFLTRLWHLYMTQGVLIGISFSFVYIPLTLVIPTWFIAKRATAFGILVGGVGLGGIVFSLTINRILSISTFRWGLRSVAFMALVTSLPSLSLRPRIKTLSIKNNLNWSFIKGSMKHTMNPVIFRIKPLMILSVWFCLAMIGYVVMLYSVSSYATSIGLSPQQSTNLTVILNIGQMFGRPMMGFLSDKYGRSNVAIIICFFNSVLILAFWINTYNYVSMIFFAIMMGCVLGIGSTVCNAIASEFIDSERLQPVWTYINIFVGLISIPAEVFALLLKTNSNTRPFLHCQIFIGICFFSCGVLMCIIRSMLVQQKLTIKEARIPTFINRIFYPMVT